MLKTSLALAVMFLSTPVLAQDDDNMTQALRAAYCSGSLYAEKNETKDWSNSLDTILAHYSGIYRLNKQLYQDQRKSLDVIRLDNSYDKGAGDFRQLASGSNVQDAQTRKQVSDQQALCRDPKF